MDGTTPPRGLHDRRETGMGLLRLLAGAVVLVFKARRLSWRLDGSAGRPSVRGGDAARPETGPETRPEGLAAALAAERAQLDALVDALGSRVAECGVGVPADLGALAAMSSIPPEDEEDLGAPGYGADGRAKGPGGPDGRGLGAAIAALAADHARVLDDIETLQALLPPHRDPATAALLEVCHAACLARRRTLTALLAARW